MRKHLLIAAAQIGAKKHVEALSKLDTSLLLCHTFTVVKHVGLVREYSEQGVDRIGMRSSTKVRNFLSMVLTMRCPSRSIATLEAVPAWQEAMKRTVLAGRAVTKEAITCMWRQIRNDIRADAARAIALVSEFDQHHG